MRDFIVWLDDHAIDLALVFAMLAILAANIPPAGYQWLLRKLGLM